MGSLTKSKMKEQKFFFTHSQLQYWRKSGILHFVVLFLSASVQGQWGLGKGCGGEA